MKCQNCGHEIHVNNRFYRAGKNGTVFCSKDCCYEAFEGFYTKKDVDKTMEQHTRPRNDLNNKERGESMENYKVIQRKASDLSGMKVEEHHVSHHVINDMKLESVSDMVMYAYNLGLKRGQGKVKIKDMERAESELINKPSEGNHEQ